MGGAVQRLEALLIALVLVIAGAAVAVTLLVRPADSLALRQPPNAMQAEPTSAPPLESSSTHEELFISMRALLPWLLLAGVLADGGLLVVRVRRRRLPYTNQSMGQFLAADQSTRMTTVRVLRDLAARGLLTGELAQITHTRPAWSSIALWLHRPQLTLAKLSLSAPRLPALRVPRIPLPKRDHVRQRVAITLPRLRWPRPAREPSALDVPAAAEPAAAPAQVTAEDRALAVAAALIEIWGAETAYPILAIDTASGPGNAPVLVMLDPHANDAQIADLPRRLLALQPNWHARWRRERLEVRIAADGAQILAGGPALLPVLRHGLRGRITSFLPLATCPHLGLYGAGATEALHALLGSVLFAQAPAELALAIIDQGEITPFYRQAAHLVRAPANDDAIDMLFQALRQRELVGLRPLLLVVVEPDETRLRALSTLLSRLRAVSGTPLHIVLVQEQPRIAGRELYALLPALITHGQGRADLLPGGAWPKRGAARLVGRGLRQEGRALSLDDAALAGMLAQLRGSQASLPACLLNLPAPDERAQVNQDGAMTDTLFPSEPGSRLGALLRAARAAGRADAPLRTLPAPVQISQAAESLVEEADNGWPSGPAPLGRIALAELMARVVAAPAITSGLPNERGLTKNRLAEQIQLPAAQAKALAETLLAWFDLAGLLAEPNHPERLRHPRALRTTDLAEIAALLHATPCPDGATVQALWARTNEGSD